MKTLETLYQELANLEQKLFDTQCNHEREQLAEKVVECENEILFVEECIRVNKLCE